MSVNASNVVWLYYPEGGSMLVLALALADEADDYGRGISASRQALARKTRQTVRAVQMQIRRMLDSGHLECISEGGSGRGDRAEYRLNLASLMTPEKGERDSPFPDQKGRTPFTLFEPERANDVHPFSGHHIKAFTKDRPTSEGDASTFTLSSGQHRDEDQRLAEWMLAQLRRLNPNHREPSWPAWCKDIRRMRERDKRTHRQIAELFAWANADQFWQGNVLSPGTLRRQWDRLTIQRAKVPGAAASSPMPAADRTCAGKCGRTGTFGERDGTWWCVACRDERQRVSA